MKTVLYHIWKRLLPLQVILITTICGILVGVNLAMAISATQANWQTEAVAEVPVMPALGIQIVPLGTPAPAQMMGMSGGIADLFTPEVQYWEAHIARWAQQYGLDPNLIATVMQIESCGDQRAGSYAGAKGLFQVMPFHFSAGEDPFDPETNAKRGLEYLQGSLKRSGGDVSLALAGYNGGWGVIGRSWANWPAETRRYSKWGSAIYSDAQLYGNQSTGLQNWLDAGGSGLCHQAATRQLASNNLPG